MNRVKMVVLFGLVVIGVIYAGSRMEKEVTKENDDKQKLEAAGAMDSGEWETIAEQWVMASGKEVLQGMEGVFVLVSSIEPEIEKYGLTRQGLKTDTELQLRQYGIKVLTREERLSTPGTPCLYVNVYVSTTEEIPFFGVAMDVELCESVILLREPKAVCFLATTWGKRGVTIAGRHRIKDIRGDVKDIVNKFINDYLAANPKGKAMDTKKKNW